MGDKGRIELEELYCGIPDESVDLTFQDLAVVIQTAISPEKRKPIAMEPFPEVTTIQGSPLRKLPSLDFNTALQATNNQQQRQPQPQPQPQPRLVDGETNHFEHARGVRYGGTANNDREAAASHHSTSSPFNQSAGFRQGVKNSMASMYQDQRGGQRRPGIPHSNICTICSTSIFLFKHRCLVCGRVYCRECVFIGMGDMAEGRKCMECLGRRFSQRYIQKAGEAGCFCWRYPNLVRQAELRWAEKGPRSNGERGFDRSVMMSSTLRSPMTPNLMTPSRAHASSIPDSFVPKSPRTPSRAHIPRSPITPSRAHIPRSPMTPSRAYGSNNPNSFAMSGSYSPYSRPLHHQPF